MNEAFSVSSDSWSVLYHCVCRDEISKASRGMDEEFFKLTCYTISHFFPEMKSGQLHLHGYEGLFKLILYDLCYTILPICLLDEVGAASLPNV